MNTLLKTRLSRGLKGGMLALAVLTMTAPALDRAMAADSVDIQALAKDVRYLKDRADISDAIHRYTRGVDRLDWDLVRKAYTSDATDDRGAFTGNVDQFLAWLKPGIEGTGGTSHNISNITYDIQGDTAHTESYVIYHVWNKDRTNLFIGGARYLDRLERRNGVWAIAHREAAMDFIFQGPGLPAQPGSVMGVRDKTDRSYVRPLGLTPEAKARLSGNK